MSNAIFSEFTDLVIPDLEPDKGQYYPGPNDILCDPGLYSFSLELLKKAKAVPSKDFQVGLRGIKFRCHRSPTANGDHFIFRRIPDSVWSLDECGINGEVKEQLLSKRLCKGGLIVVAGTPGNGKSTTCAAIIKERLELFGGTCLTVEDPIEMPLHGMIGNGMCMQRNLDSDETFHEAVKDTLRGYPSSTNTILMIGEIRDAETAALALQASIDGRLVIFSIHAGSIIQSLYRIISLSSNVLGNKDAIHILSSSVRVLLHQTLENRHLNLNALIDTYSVAGIISSAKGNSLDALKNEIEFQKIRRGLGQKIDVRTHFSSKSNAVKILSNNSPVNKMNNNQSKSLNTEESLRSEADRQKQALKNKLFSR